MRRAARGRHGRGIAAVEQATLRLCIGNICWAARGGMKHGRSRLVRVRVDQVIRVGRKTIGTVGVPGLDGVVVVIGWERAIRWRVHLAGHVRVSAATIRRWVARVGRGPRVIVGWGVVKWELGVRMLGAPQWIVVTRNLSWVVRSHHVGCIVWGSWLARHEGRVDS